MGGQKHPAFITQQALLKVAVCHIGKAIAGPPNFYWMPEKGVGFIRNFKFQVAGLALLKGNSFVER